MWDWAADAPTRREQLVFLFLDPFLSSQTEPVFRTADKRCLLNHIWNPHVTFTVTFTDKSSSSTSWSGWVNQERKARLMRAESAHSFMLINAGHLDGAGWSYRVITLQISVVHLNDSELTVMEVLKQNQFELLSCVTVKYSLGLQRPIIFIID